MPDDDDPELQARILEVMADLVRHGYAVLNTTGLGNGQPFIEMTPLGRQRAADMVGVDPDADTTEFIQAAAHFLRDQQ